MSERKNAFNAFVYEKGALLERFDHLKVNITKFLDFAALSRKEDSICIQENRNRANSFRKNVIGLREYIHATKKMKAAFYRGHEAKLEAKKEFDNILEVIGDVLSSLKDGTENISNYLVDYKNDFERVHEEEDLCYMHMIEAADKLHMATLSISDSEATVSSLYGREIRVSEDGHEEYEKLSTTSDSSDHDAQVNS